MAGPISVPTHPHALFDQIDGHAVELERVAAAGVALEQERAPIAHQRARFVHPAANSLHLPTHNAACSQRGQQINLVAPDTLAREALGA
jgi:hypothetical protein